MKYTIFAILLIFILTQKPRPECTRVSCICVDTNSALVIRPNCPNPKYNNCLSSVPCVRINGTCQFLKNTRFEECQKHNKLPCVVGGCNGELCTEQNTDGSGMISICLWKLEFACYKNARCERQTDGLCGWKRDST
jgi:hypothetical protein